MTIQGSKCINYMPKFDIDYCKHSFIRIQIIDKK